jgi:hypothetical protein
MDYLADHRQLVGSFRSDLHSLDDIRHHQAFGTVAEWFANLSRNSGEGLKREDIEAFTREHGLLRWNWTHEGWGGSEYDRFYLPVHAFKSDHEAFLQNWRMASRGVKKAIKTVCEWLGVQLRAESQISNSQDIEASDAWKLHQPRLALEVGSNPQQRGALEVRLIFGDLWQALCSELLDKLIRQHGSIHVCDNDPCPSGQTYFIAKDPRQKYCTHYCAKLVADRKHARRKRVALRRQKTSRKEKE